MGYTNAGKSTILNRMSQAGVLAENMLFATLDSTVRKVRLDKADFKDFSEFVGYRDAQDCIDVDGQGKSTKGQEVLLTDTVGFISKIPSDLVVAFRSTLEQVKAADVLVHVCDCSNPTWKKQREVVLAELAAIGCTDTPMVELWNKVDLTDDPWKTIKEAKCAPVETQVISTSETYDRNLPGENYDPLVTMITCRGRRGRGGRGRGRGRGREEEEEEEEEEYAPIRAGRRARCVRRSQ